MRLCKNTAWYTFPEHLVSSVKLCKHAVEHLGVCCSVIERLSSSQRVNVLLGKAHIHHV